MTTTTEITTAAELGEAVRAGKPVWRGFTVDGLDKAFELVKPPEDWKAPIAVYVTGELVNVVIAAIQFYTATDPTGTYVPSNWPAAWLIESVGYRAGPAGDH